MKIKIELLDINGDWCDLMVHGNKMEIKKGDAIELEVKSGIKCPKCEGDTWMWSVTGRQEECAYCNGKGYIPCEITVCLCAEQKG